jgi:hypothetical protein
MNDMVRVSVRLCDPSGQRCFEIFPTYLVEWQDDEWARNLAVQALAQGAQSCPIEPPFSAEEFLIGRLVAGFRRGAEVLERKPAPEVARAAQEKARAQVASMGSNPQLRVDAMRIKIRSGNTEEWLLATTSTVAMQTMSPTAASQGQMGWQNYYYCLAENIYGLRAPAGELERNEPLLAAMIGSIRVNPEWEAAIAQVRSNIGRTIQQGIADRARIMRQAQQEIADIQMRTWEHSQATQDRVMTSWSQAIRGTASYIDPGGSLEVELPDHYDTVWSNGLGEYALVTTPGLDPNQHLEGSWTEWQKKP